LLQDLSVYEIGGDALSKFPETLLGAAFEGKRHEWIADLAEGAELEEGKALNACCAHSRLHASFQLQYPEGAELSQSCKSHGKLHHFQFDDEESNLATDPLGRYEKLVYRCSRGRCRAHLLIQLRKAEIDQNVLDDVFRIRPLASFAAGPPPADKPTRFSTLMALEYFVRHTAEFKATEAMPRPREISVAPTSHFVKLVGREPETVALMRHLRFTLAPADWDRVSFVDERDIVQDLDEAEEDEMIEWLYYPPDPRQPGIRDLLRRIRLELQILAMTTKKASPQDPNTKRNWNVSHERAEAYWLVLMEAEERFYTKESVPWIHDTDSPGELAYAKLGITAAFHDLATLDFFELQICADQRNLSWYLSALEVIANKRKSESLQMEVSRQRSMGSYTRQDLARSYRILQSVQSDDDETLINIAASLMLDDQDGSDKQRVRDALAIIGEERDSAVIRKYLNAPQKDFADTDTALQYLGAQPETDDEMLIFLFNERRETNEQLARSALSTIADERQNTRLRRFLDTGEDAPLPSVKFTLPDKSAEDAELEVLDPDLAYSRLGVDDKSVDDEMLITLFDIRQLDDPEATPALRKALEVIGDIRRSATIRAFLTGKKVPIEPYQPPEASLDRPVGMENIGNTCYLNSLLQYYFTIKPLREAILQMEDFAERELTDDILGRKKVGGRLVTKQEVERALRFMRELRALFLGLMTCKEASLKPSKAVCFLALVSSRDEANAAQEEILEGVSPTHLVKGTGMDLPVTDTNQMVLFKSPELEMSRTDSGITMADDAFVQDSDTTMVDSSDPSPKRKTITPPNDKDLPEPSRLRTDSPEPMDTAEDAEDFTLKPMSYELPPDLVDLSQTVTPADSQPPPAAANDTEWADVPDASNDWQNVDPETLQAKPVLSLATKPGPALPDRPKQRRKSSLLWSDSNDWGKQQDVAECIDNVLFQISAALKPSGGHHPIDGEQIDLVKDLFFGITRQRISIPGNEPKEERFSNTIVNLEHDGQSLYDALDGVFDVRPVELDNKQVYLTSLLAKAPVLFQVQIQRADFDRATMQAIKKNTYLKLDETIYLDRYMDTDDEELQNLRVKYAEYKRELSSLRSERMRLRDLKTAQDANLTAAVAKSKAGPTAAPIPPAYNDHDWIASAREVASDDGHDDAHMQTSGILEMSDSHTSEGKRHGSVHELALAGDANSVIRETLPEVVEPAVKEEPSIEDMQQALHELEEQLETNEAQIMTLSAAALSIFDDELNVDNKENEMPATNDVKDLLEMSPPPTEEETVIPHRQHAYRLSSVFMHRGAANHGHYWIFIYDFANGKWRKYNDETVTEVTADEAVHRDLTGMTENPYMLTYIRADAIDRVSQALVRDWNAEPSLI
jgi:ubiquitin carboxyl-terminal hydrolase 25/28